MRPWMRRLVWAIVVFAGVLGLAWLLLPEPIPVDVAVIERGALQVTVDEEGQTRVRDRYVVSAPLTGRLRRLDLEAGDTVEAGQALARMDPPAPTLLDAREHLQAIWQVAAAQTRVQRAEAEIERVTAELSFAEEEYQRAQRLAATEVATRRELRQAERDYRVQQQAMEVAQRERQVAEYELAQARAVVNITAVDAQADVDAQPDVDVEDRMVLAIRAPAAGRVLRVLQESEAFVNAGTPLLEVGDPHRLEVVADLLSEEAARVTAGAPVRLERWGGPASLQGRVRRVEPSGFTDISALGVEEQRVNVIIDFAEPIEAYAQLGDGYRVDVRIVTWEDEDVLRVPTGALFREGDQWMVFRIEDDRAVRQPVAIGRQSPLLAEVTRGLSEGDRVVMYPGDRVADGVRVTVRE